eukprot:12250467-Karenia_brevis.AAC.1
MSPSAVAAVGAALDNNYVKADTYDTKNYGNFGKFTRGLTVVVDPTNTKTRASGDATVQASTKSIEVCTKIA